MTAFLRQNGITHLTITMCALALVAMGVGCSDDDAPPPPTANNTSNVNNANNANNANNVNNAVENNSNGGTNGNNSVICETPNTTLCGEVCVDLMSADEHCGDCGVVCDAPPTGGAALCTAGECAVECFEGFRDCEGSCARCPDDAVETVCDGDACVASSCPSRQRLCEGQCAICPDDENAEETACEASDCVVTTCNAGFHLCNGGCVADSSTSSCGASCTPCDTPANGVATCAEGVCGVECNQGAMLCEGACALCDGSNASTFVCDGAACVAETCADGFDLCGGTCTVCPTDNVTSTTCEGIACVAESCADGFLACGGTCATCADDSNALTYTCNLDEDCVSATCEVGFMACDGTCAICPAEDGVEGVECRQGACVATGCDDGYVPCDGGCCAWGQEPVDMAGIQAGGRVELVASADGTLHAVYEVGEPSTEVRYATWAGGAWTVSTVQMNASRPSIALGSDGAPHIAMGVTGPDRVVHATPDGADGWTLEDVESAGLPLFTNVVVEDGGEVHIAYGLTADELAHASDDPTWTVERLTNRSAQYADLFIRNGSVWMCYLQSDDSVGCAQEPTNWNHTPIGVATSGLSTHKPRISASLRNETVYVSYANSGVGMSLAQLMSNNDVSVETVDTTTNSGAASVLRFDAAFNTHIAYMTPQTGLLYAVKDGGLWTVSSLQDVVADNRYVAFALGADEIPHIVYFNASSDTLMHYTLR